MAWRRATRPRLCQGVQINSDAWNRNIFSDVSTVELPFFRGTHLESPNGSGNPIRRHLDRWWPSGSVCLGITPAHGHYRPVGDDNGAGISSVSSNNRTDGYIVSFFSAEGHLAFTSRKKLPNHLVCQKIQSDVSQMFDSEIQRIRLPRSPLPSTNTLSLQILDTQNASLKSPHLTNPRPWTQGSAACNAVRCHAFHSAASNQKREIQGLTSFIPSGTPDDNMQDTVSLHSPASEHAHLTSQADAPSFPWKPYPDASLPESPPGGRTAAHVGPGSTNEPLTGGDDLAAASWTNAVVTAAIACLPVDYVANAFVAAQAVSGLPW